MRSIKKINIFSRDKRKLMVGLYLFSFLLFSFTTYLNIPKLLNFSVVSLKENVKKNNDINIQKISKINYKIFPTPRLSITNANFTVGEEILEVTDSDLEIVLNLSQILNFKKINYKKLVINKGSTKINLNNINQLVTIINNNNKKIVFRENNLIFFKKDASFFEIEDTSINIEQSKKKKELTLNGSFLNNKISIKFNNSLENKNNLILKIPKLDIATRIFFENNISGSVKGLFNLKVINNFLKFNFIKNDSLKLSEGFIRNKLISSALEGEITIKPNFFLKLDFEPTTLNMEKLLPLIQKTYFSGSTTNPFLIKKINGIFNFKSKIEGRITNKNGEVVFEEFKIGKDKSFSFSAKIVEFGSKGKVQFNLVKIIKYKKKTLKKIGITGLLQPSNSKIIFEKFSLDGIELSAKKTKEHEDEFKDYVIQDSLANIFKEEKINAYFKNLF